MWTETTPELLPLGRRQEGRLTGRTFSDSDGLTYSQKTLWSSSIPPVSQQRSGASMPSNVSKARREAWISLRQTKKQGHTRPPQTERNQQGTYTHTADTNTRLGGVNRHHHPPTSHSIRGSLFYSRDLNEIQSPNIKPKCPGCINNHYQTKNKDLH